MLGERWLGTIKKDNRYFYVAVIMFVVAAVAHGLMSDFPKVISGYPDELRYVGIGRSLIKGQGLLLHGMESGFQKILYSICITPAFFIKSTAGQIRVVGYINSLIMVSAVFQFMDFAGEF